MNALVYHGPDDKSWDEVSDAVLIDETDAIMRVDATTICCSDLHILKCDRPELTRGRILGDEAVGTMPAVGKAVKNQDLDELLQVEVPGIEPWAGGNRPLYFRLVVTSMSGKRIISVR